VVGIAGSGSLLGQVPQRFPLLRVVFRHETKPGPTEGDRSSFDAGRVVLQLGEGRSLDVDRVSAAATTATCWSTRPPTASEAVHPLLTAAAAVAGVWSGYDSFHAAGVMGEAGLWAIVGDKESGKSTVAAAMAAAGHPVACDDLLALRGPVAYAGPRCIDLRTDSARFLDMGHEIATNGPRSRWRVTLPPLDAELPMAGWVILKWAQQVEMVQIAPRDLLARLSSHRTWPGSPIDSLALLDLASLPAWELRRPRAWSSLPAVVAALDAALCPRRSLTERREGAGPRG
jgi:hypothetical protein